MSFLVCLSEAARPFLPLLSFRSPRSLGLAVLEVDEEKDKAPKGISINMFCLEWLLRGDGISDGEAQRVPHECHSHPSLNRQLGKVRVSNSWPSSSDCGGGDYRLTSHLCNDCGCNRARPIQWTPYALPTPNQDTNNVNGRSTNPSQARHEHTPIPRWPT